MDRTSVYRKAALDRLSSPEQLDQLMRVTSPRSWVVLTAFLTALLVLVAWGILDRVTTRIPVEGMLAEDAQGALTAQVHLTAEEAARIAPGMTAHIVPAAWRPQEHGYVIGTVEQRIDGRLSADSRVAIAIRLLGNQHSAGRYEWTSGSGPERELQPGTPIVGSIVIEARRPIEVAIPALGQLFSPGPAAR